MFRIISRLQVPPLESRLSFLCSRKRISFEVATWRSKASRASTNRPSLNSRCLRSPTDDDSDELSPLDKGQLAQLYSGRFPTDFSGEAIYIRTSRDEFHRLVDAFDETSDERKRTITLSFNEPFSTTSIRVKQTALHVNVVEYINGQIRRDVPRNREIIRAANYRFIEGLSEPDFQIRYRQIGNPMSDPGIAFEIGFSQPSEELEQKVKALLENSPAKVAVLFDFKESPNYRNPFIWYKTGNGNRAQADKTNRTVPLNRTNIEIFKSQRQQTDAENSMCLENSRNPYGPLLVYGLRWVGELTGSVQVFAKDLETGKAIARTRKMLFYGRQEMSDQQWKLELQRLQRQRTRTGKHRGGCEERVSKAREDGKNIYENESEVESTTGR